jgi:hypothetical protein
MKNAATEVTEGTEEIEEISNLKFEISSFFVFSVTSVAKWYFR